MCGVCSRSDCSMNVYTAVLVLPLIRVTNTDVVIDGEMTFDVQVVNDNNDKYYSRQMLDETGKEKRDREERVKYIPRKRKIIKEINDTDQLKSSKRDQVKLNDKQNGEVKDRHIGEEKNKRKAIERERDVQERKVIEKSKEDRVEFWKQMITKAVDLECVYQYPERNQMEGLLSDMLNQLTRLIVSAHGYNAGNADYAGDADNAGDADDRDDAHDVSDTWRPEKRFRVVSDRSPAVFETVFKRLSAECQKFYNTTLQKVDRSKDPCANQVEIKKTWQQLLAQSQHILRRSTLRAVELIFPRSRADDSRHEEMKRMLGEELAKMRSEQLDSLCDNFQLCYSDLL